MFRRQLREYTFKMLFHKEFYPSEELEEQVDNFLQEEDELTEEQRVAMAARAKDIFDKIPELDEQIAAVSEGWKLDRMSKVDLTIIRLALYEMRYDDQVPDKVAVNEAVEIAKKFGGDNSPQFVNGILAKLIK